MHPLRFGLKLSQAATIDTLTAIWGIADDSGFDHCWNMDHFASLGPDDSRDIFEAWTLLAGMAAHTSHTRIGCSVTEVRSLFGLRGGAFVPHHLECGS